MDPFDEAFAADGRPRRHYRALLESLDRCDLTALSEAVAGDVAEEGIEFGTVDGAQPFRLDPVPRILDAGESDLLERGIAQRARALSAFLADFHGERRMIATGRLPARVVDGSPLAEDDMRAIAPHTRVHAGIGGFDVVRDGSGELRVLEDNLRAPSGLAYAIAARRIADGRLPLDPPAERAPLAILDALRATLVAAAPGGDPEPSIAVLSDGPRNSAWWEHRVLAESLGVPVVTPAQLETRGGRLRLRDGGRAVDVVYRRTDEHRLRDEAGELTWLGELLLEPLCKGTAACVNACGAGVADDKLVHAYVEEMVRFYLGEEPLLRSVTTYDPADSELRRELLGRIGELVVKPRYESGGAGVIVCPHASAEDVERAGELIRTRPHDFVAQETVAISTHPTVIGPRLEPRHVDLRPYSFETPGGARVSGGGLTRVALDRGALVVNSAQNGGAKDTWLLRERR